MSSNPVPAPHQLALSEISYGQPPNQQSYIRIFKLFKKPPEISFNYFLKHLNHAHTDLVINMRPFKENNVFHYS
jgi:hypothetical protein